jgi:UDP-N-acetylmuramate dehydrogenase
MTAPSPSVKLRGELLRDEPLARHTSWRVGGPAARMYRPADAEDLAAFLNTVPPQEPVYWVGLGSNLLVRDGGWRGTVIMTSGRLNGLSRIGPNSVRAEAGVPSAKVARFSVDQGLTGAEFLAGIPGTVGGALAMNAGAFGGETWRIVRAVETIDQRGELRTRLPADYHVGYRHVQGAVGEWFVAAHFQLRPGDAQHAKSLIKTLLGKRGATQPTQLPNAGSVFKNPANDFAARLIEASGLKGLRVGGACVSDLHANFIVNTGAASARDIEALIAEVQERVWRAHAVRLEPEVRIVGEEAAS